MFKKIAKKAKQLGQKAKKFVKAKIQKIKTTIKTAEIIMKCQAHSALVGTKAEAYVDTGVKILIAVVIGALLLTLLYSLFKGTIMPKVTEKVDGIFNYAG